MSQSGYTPILTYGSTTASNVPLAANLTTSSSGVELAINAADGKLFYKDNLGVVQVLATKGTGPIGGSNTQVQYNSSGSLAGSANLTFDGTTLTAAGFSGPHNGTVGATTPNTGAFTTLTTSSTVTINGGTANGVAYLNGSKVLTTGSALTFNGTNTQTLQAAAAATATLNLYGNGVIAGLILQGGSDTNGYISSTNSLYFGTNNVSRASINTTGTVTINPATSGITLDVGAGSGTNASIRTNGSILLSGAGGIPASVAAMLNYESPNTRFYIGDGTGYSFLFSKRVGGVTTDLVQFADSGNVGIGTTSPGAKLDVQGTGSGVASIKSTSSAYSLKLLGSTTVNPVFLGASGDTFVTYVGGADRMTIGSSGNVTINAPSSGNAMTLKGLSATDILQIQSTTGATGNLAAGWAAGINVGQWNIYTTSTDSMTLGCQGTAGITFATSSANRATIGAGGNVTINAPASNNALTVTAVGTYGAIKAVATTAGSNSFIASPGSATGVAYSFDTNGTVGMYQSAVNNIDFGVLGSSAININSTRNVTIFAPGSGTALAVSSGSLPDSAITVYTSGDITTNGPSAYLRFNYNNNANVGGYIGYGGFANQLEIYNYLNGPISFITNSTARMNIGGAGNVTINAPTTGVAMTVNGSSDAYALNISSTTTASNNRTLNVYNSAATGTTALNNHIVRLASNGSGADCTLQFTDSVANNGYIGMKSGALNFGANTTTTQMTLDTSGNLLVGTTTASFNSSNSTFFYQPTGYWVVNHANGTSTGTRYIGFGYNTGEIGSITQSGTTAVLYNTTSDQRLKENITDADSASDLIDAIKVRQFDWIGDGTHQRYGMVAQELYEVAPEAVHAPEDPDAMMAVDYSKLVPMLIKEIQSLRQRVAQLEVK